MEKNNIRLLRIFIYINILFIISLVVPFAWNPIFIIETFTIEYLLGDFTTVITLIILLILFIILYRKIELNYFNFILIWLIFVFSYQLFSIVELINSLSTFDKSSSVSITYSYTYFLQSWSGKINLMFDGNISSITSSLLDIRTFGLLQFILFLITFGNLNIITSMVFNTVLLLVFACLFILVLVKRYLKHFDYIRISNNSIKTYIIGQYNLNDLESFDISDRSFFIEYKKEKKMEKENFIERIKNNEQDIVLLIKTKWCGECHMLNQVFKRISEDNSFDNLIFEIIDADQFDIWEESENFFNIKEVPTIIYYHSGKEIDRITNFVSEIKLNDFITKNQTKEKNLKEQKTI